MSTVNPMMQSAIQYMSPQQAPVGSGTEKMSDKTTSAASSSGNTTVTLSASANQKINDYSNLAANKRINQAESVENGEIKKNDTTNTELTSSSALQARANYYQGQSI